MTSKSSTITRKKADKEPLLPLITPGEFLAEEFLEPLRLSGNALALALRVPANRIQGIINGQRAITADTDLRLARYFGMSEGFFIGLQTDYELMQRRREIGDKLKAIRPRAA